MGKVYGSISNYEYLPSDQRFKMGKGDEKQHLLSKSNSKDSQPDPTQPNVIDLENVTSPGSDDDPVSNRCIEHPTSNFDTLIHLLKGNVGTGILAMPDAFRNSGWVIGLFGTLIMGAICTHCMHILVVCSHELCRRTQRPFLGFSEVVETAFETGPEKLQKCSKMARLLTNIFLFVTQMGFCCVYFVFVAANVHEVVKHYYVDLDVKWYLLMFLIPMILLNWIKNLKYLMPASLFASIIMCIGLVITFYYIFRDLPPVNNMEVFSSWSQLALYFGTAIYAFEGIGVILPLENNMARPQDFGGWSGVLNTGMVMVAILYTFIGFFGYLKYGDKAVLGSVTLLLPSDEMLAQSVRVMMAVAIFLSYGLQFYVPFNIIWPQLEHHFTTDKSKKIAEYLTRTFMVFVTFTLAICIPNLGAVISLVGAVSSSALALLFPPMIDILTFWPGKLGSFKWKLWKDLGIILFGFTGFLVGSYVSILNILYPEETS